MLTHSLIMLLCVGLSGPIGQAQPEQPPGGEEGRRDRGARWRERRDRGNGPSDEERRQWRERQERYRSASPEERRQLRMERWVEMSARLYELSEEQKGTVRKEIEAMDAERRAAMGAEADEYDRLRDQMFELWARRAEDTSQRDEGERPNRDERRRMREDPEFQKLRERMEELDAKYPFDMDAARRRIEKLLPEEQVKKANTRWEERRAEWQQRREGRDGPRDERRRERRDRPAAGGPLAARPAPPPPDRAGQPAEKSDRAAAEADRRTAETVPPPPPKPLHPWEKYVREFIARYELTEAQAATAHSILKDMMNRAAQIEAANASKIAEAEKIVDRTAREARLRELNKPIEQTFEDLKLRLGALLTADQLAKKGDV